MVAVSGGKDSYTLLHLLRSLQSRAPVRFELKVVNIDQGHPGYPAERLTGYMARGGHEFRMVAEDAYAIVPLEWWAQRTAGLAGNTSPPPPLRKDPTT